MNLPSARQLNLQAGVASFLQSVGEEG